LLYSDHMKLIDEFKAFAMRGNIIDLAFAVIIGTAFGKIVSSLVENIIMPPIGFLIGGVSFSELAISLQTGVSAPVLIKYGIFIQAILDFVIIAAVLFFALKGLTKLQKKKEEVEEAPKVSAELKVLEEIRDALKKP
jgi:large conductance mechanosensitive channel